MEKIYNEYKSPLGLIWLVESKEGLERVILSRDEWNVFKSCERLYTKKDLDASIQLDEYFKGVRKNFDVLLHLESKTEFIKETLTKLMEIPYGSTMSYTELAKSLGRPKAVRAVGQANKKNPLPIFIPCHRVIGKDGKLTGYMGKEGMHIKEFLLEHEKKIKEICFSTSQNGNNIL